MLKNGRNGVPATLNYLASSVNPSLVRNGKVGTYGDTTQIFTIILPIAILFNHALK